MQFKLKDKTALVTASTGGIGRAIAEALLKEGAHVIINGRSAQSVNRALKELKTKYPNVSGVAADLKDQKGANKLIKGVKQPVDILINNFGMYEVKDFFSISDDMWLEFFEANVMSGIRLARHYLKPMLKRNWGRVLFISSESGLNIPEDMIQYGVTKTAQLSVMRGLAKLTKGTHVTVNALLPGPTLTEGVEVFLKELAKKQGITLEAMEHQMFKKNRPTSLIQRFAKPEEVAPMAVYLSSPLSALTNGSAVKVEGGILDQIN